MAKVPDSWRTREQVLLDLCNALHFSPDSLEQNRKGNLSAEQWQRLFICFLRPVLMGAAFILGPFVVWTLIGVLSGSDSLGGSLHYVFSAAFQPRLVLEYHGWFVSGVIVLATLGGIGFGIYKASRVSMALYFDLIERKVIIKEGRVESREDQVFRSGARDPIESFFFHLKTDKFEVNSAAVQALDNGAAYYVYLLPRSRTLVAIEPRMSAGDGVAIAG